MRRVLAVFAAVSFVLVPVRSRATPTIVDLGLLDGFTTGEAAAINVFGEVVGRCVAFEPGSEAGRSRAFLWTPWGGMVDLGSLGGTYTYPIHVTPFGTVVGGESLPEDEASRRPFVWTPWSGLSALPLMGVDTVPVAANDFGQVVGFFDPNPWLYDSHAFSWTPWGGMVDLGTMGDDSSVATSVGNGGHVAGQHCRLEGMACRAWVWSRKTGTIQLGALGGQENLGGSSYARAVNASGQVVGGSSTPGGSSHAFSWTAKGGMIDLGTLGTNGSEALLVNDRGQVAGVYYGGATAFYWSAQEGMIDVGSLGGGVSWPLAIGPTGQIVGQSDHVDPNDPLGVVETHAFSWTKRGGIVDLGTLPGGTHSVAYAVNASGIVVGASNTANPEDWHPVLWFVGR